jgi:hypothetical protein
MPGTPPFSLSGFTLYQSLFQPLHMYGHSQIEYVTQIIRRKLEILDSARSQRSRVHFGVESQGAQGTRRILLLLTPLPLQSQAWIAFRATHSLATHKATCHAVFTCL